MKTTLTLLLLVSVQAFAEGGGSSIGPSHPASRLCNALAGDSIAITLPAGQDELCRLNDAIISTMTLWYSMNSGLEAAARFFLEHPVRERSFGGNPASEYCVQIGGDSQAAQLADGTQMGVCVFSENGHLSLIDEWTLYRGPFDTGNKRLVDLLRH